MSENHSVHVTVGRIINVVSIDDEVFYPVVSVSRSSLPEQKLPEPAPLVTTVETTVELPQAPARRRNRFKRFCSCLGTFATAVVTIIAIILVGLKIAGFRTFTVMSGSMEPEYPVGSMIYVKPINYKSLKVGDVISYVANNDKTIVTHRIVAIERDSKDPETLRFKTQGDANSAPDANLVHYKNVLGTPVIIIPHIGYFAHNIQQPPGIYIALVVGTLLLAWTFLPGTLEERRKTARKSIA